MTVDLYMAIVDTGILILLIAWSWMDRNEIYFKNKDK